MSTSFEEELKTQLFQTFLNIFFLISAEKITEKHLKLTKKHFTSKYSQNTHQQGKVYYLLRTCEATLSFIAVGETEKMCFYKLYPKLIDDQTSSSAPCPLAKKQLCATKRAQLKGKGGHCSELCAIIGF